MFYFSEFSELVCMICIFKFGKKLKFFSWTELIFFDVEVVHIGDFTLIILLRNFVFVVGFFFQIDCFRLSIDLHVPSSLCIFLSMHLIFTTDYLKMHMWIDFQVHQLSFL